MYMRLNRRPPLAGQGQLGYMQVGYQRRLDRAAQGQLGYMQVGYQRRLDRATQGMLGLGAMPGVDSWGAAFTSAVTAAEQAGGLTKTESTDLIKLGAKMAVILKKGGKTAADDAQAVWQLMHRIFGPGGARHHTRINYSSEDPKEKKKAATTLAVWDLANHALQLAGEATDKAIGVSGPGTAILYFGDEDEDDLDFGGPDEDDAPTGGRGTALIKKGAPSAAPTGGRGTTPIKPPAKTSPGGAGIDPKSRDAALLKLAYGRRGPALTIGRQRQASVSPATVAGIGLAVFATVGLLALAFRR